MVSLDFLVPATVLGMIGPVVAKMAVEQARHSGSAIGDVYFWGAVGSIAGTFLAGFVLMYLAPTSTIVAVVAAALALLAAALIGDLPGAVVGVLAAACLGLGAFMPLVRSIPVRGVTLGSIEVNPLALVGHALTLVLAVVGALRLSRARPRGGASPVEDAAVGEAAGTAQAAAWATWRRSRSWPAWRSWRLEMVAGRLVTRHLGSSLYGWTSIIGVLLGGLSLGNLLGGQDRRPRASREAGELALPGASVLTLSILLLESPPKWFSENVARRRQRRS